MTSFIIDYTDALERLKANKPLRVSKGIHITNDSVALEAGRGKGSIKKSRDVFADLILAIAEAATAQEQLATTDKAKLDMAKSKTSEYREQLDAAHAREVSLLHEVYELKKQLAVLTGSSVIPIRKVCLPGEANGHEADTSPFPKNI